MEASKTPAERAASLTPEQRKKVKRAYRIAAFLEAIILVFTILIACGFYKKAHDCRLLASNWYVGAPYTITEMNDREDAMIKYMVRSSLVGGAAVLVVFGVWTVISPNNRESIYKAVRKLEKAEKQSAEAVATGEMKDR